MNSGCLAGIADTGPTPKAGTDYDRGYTDSGGASRFMVVLDDGDAEPAPTPLTQASLFDRTGD
jgi:hypothetical protein